MVKQVAVEDGLALLVQPDRHVHLGARLLRHELPQERHVGGRHFHVDEEVGAREREQDQQLVLLQQQRIEIQLLAVVLQDGHREGQLDVPVHRLADDVGGLVAEKERPEHLDLQAWPRAGRPREMRAQRVHDACQVAPQILERIGEPEVARDRAQHRAQAGPSLARVIAAVGRFVALEVLGRDRRPPENELVAVVAPVQHLAGHRVEEGLGEFRLAVLVEQGDVGELDRRPERLVGFGLRKPREQALHAFLHAAVVHRHALARQLEHRGPVRLLEQRLRADRGLAKEAIVAVEPREDRARDFRRAGRTLLVQPENLGRLAHQPLADPPPATGREG